MWAFPGGAEVVLRQRWVGLFQVWRRHTEADKATETPLVHIDPCGILVRGGVLFTVVDASN